MSAGRWAVGRLVDDLSSLGERGLPRDEYFGEVAARLRRVVDCDATCWHTIDPQTRLITSEAPQELIDEGVFTPDTASQAGARVVASEYFLEDVNTFAGLASRRIPVGILSQATHGQPERSARYRDVLAPAGIPFELRAAFVARGRCWGAVHVARRAESRDFTAEDAVALAAVTRVVADGIRTSLRFDAARRAGDGAAPGLVVLDAKNEVELITEAAHEILAEMRSPALTASAQAAPSALLGLAAFMRSRRGRSDRGAGAVVVPVASGWITLHASLPGDGVDGRVAIVLERAASPQATAVRLEARGVTRREREIATLIAQGLTNAEIAAALVLSPFTVQDHIKSLLEKVGVSSRQELVARVFLDDYLPHVTRRTPVTSTGGFAPAGGP